MSCTTVSLTSGVRHAMLWPGQDTQCQCRLPILSIHGWLGYTIGRASPTQSAAVKTDPDSLLPASVRHAVQLPAGCRSPTHQPTPHSCTQTQAQLHAHSTSQSPTPGPFVSSLQRPTPPGLSAAQHSSKQAIIAPHTWQLPRCFQFCYHQQCCIPPCQEAWPPCPAPVRRAHRLLTVS